MLRIIAKKIAQRDYQEELNDYRRDAAEEAADSDKYDYFIRETLIQSGREVTQDVGDYSSAEEAANIAMGYLEDAKEMGVVSLDIYSKTDGWIRSIWNKDDEQPMAQPMAQPMMQPFSR